MPFEELKERQSRMWGNGPYENVTATLLDVHDLVLERLNPRPGIRWLDLACGTGALTERGSRAGADVTGIDLAPVLIETARNNAAAAGLDIAYEVGDCENLVGVVDGSFDAVSSTFGVMFAPDHEATARELGRVTAPGGRIALASWTPDGGLGRLFKVMAPFQPAPPPGTGSPFAWGVEAHVRELLGDDFDLEIEEHVSTYRVPSGEEYWQVFSSSYGPTKTLAESLEDDRREELHRNWVDLFESEYRDGDEIAHTREYLLVLGTRR